MIVSGDVLTGNTTGKVNSNSPLSLPSGSVTTPGVSFTSDSDTGLYNPSPNNLGFVTAGTEKLRVDGDGQQSSVVPGGTTLLPLFGCRAWVNFNGVQSGTLTYTISGTLVTVSQSSHGMTSGMVANLTFSSGTVSGTANYTVTRVDDNSYTVVSAVSGSTGGNVVRNNFMRGFGNVSGVTRNGTSDYTVNFTTPMPDANYCVLLTIGTLTSASTVRALVISSTTLPTTTALRVAVVNVSGSAEDFAFNNVAIFR